MAPIIHKRPLPAVARHETGWEAPSKERLLEQLGRRPRPSTSSTGRTAPAKRLPQYPPDGS